MVAIRSSCCRAVDLQFHAWSKKSRWNFIPMLSEGKSSSVCGVRSSCACMMVKITNKLHEFDLLWIYCELVCIICRQHIEPVEWLSLTVHVCADNRQLSVCVENCFQYRPALVGWWFHRRLILCAVRYGRLGVSRAIHQRQQIYLYCHCDWYSVYRLQTYCITMCECKV